MNIVEITEMMPELTKLDIQQLVKAGLEREFVLHNLTKEDMLIPKEEKAYLIKRGSALACAYTDDGLEFNMEFQEGDGIGHLNIFIEDSIDFILFGMDECTVIEIPLKKTLQTTNIKFILSFYEKILSTMSKNLLKVLKKYTAKINYSNEQYFLDFIMDKGGILMFSTTDELSRLLNIEVRTVQRIIKKFSERGILVKREGTIEILNYETVKQKIISQRKV